ncbi:hypothetical protein [Natronosalvus caseinilyticus]|uniref:hypothetical protein n=1 Tax=Natronosalvus caseinilyticus TaxID=2953747 RepID=UPI0028A6FDC1|nr:hypothetical protein [Natronosalvus caseinilyticus]
MDVQRRGQILLDHITFGQGAHFLLEVLLLQFASVFLTFQFSSSLLIEISKPDLFIYAYTGVSIVFFGVLVLFTAKMRKRTFSPSLYSRTRLAVSVLGYLIASGLVILFGYILLIFVLMGETRIGQLDYVFSGMLTTLFAALLAVGYHARIADDRPNRDTMVETITGWDDSHSWINEDDRSNAKQEAYGEFVDRMDDLSSILYSAKTVEGKLLREDFEGWRDDFESHSELSKETIIKGQREKKNERLEQEHQKLASIRHRLRIIAGKQ